LAVGGRFTEAPIEVGDELRQVGLRGRDGANLAQAQFADQAILQRGPESLHSPLALRRARRDVTDGEALEHPAHMRRCLCSRELLFDRPVGAIADEQIQAIAVHGHRHGRGGAAGRRWDKRATVRYMAKNDARSIADCREALARNPNHFGDALGPAPLPSGAQRVPRSRRSVPAHARCPSAPRERPRESGNGGERLVKWN